MPEIIEIPQPIRFRSLASNIPSTTDAILKFFAVVVLRRSAGPFELVVNPVLTHACFNYGRSKKQLSNLETVTGVPDAGLAIGAGGGVSEIGASDGWFAMGAGGGMSETGAFRRQVLYWSGWWRV